MSERGDRLQARFNLIQGVLVELYGDEVATCAASAAYLRAIQYGAKESMKQLSRQIESEAWVAEETIRALDAEHEKMLQSFHKYLCERLGVTPAIALRHSHAFEQIIRDICFQGG